MKAPASRNSTGRATDFPTGLSMSHALNLFRKRKQIRNANIGKFFCEYVPENYVMHCTRFFGRIPFFGSNYSVGSLVCGINDCLDFLSLHEWVIGCVSGIFRLARNRLHVERIKRSHPFTINFFTGSLRCTSVDSRHIILASSYRNGTGNTIWYINSTRGECAKSLTGKYLVRREPLRTWTDQAAKKAAMHRHRNSQVKA
ncbi:hypothetical protein ABH945_005646 [Paraburkholderia sp. GAS333]